MATASMAKLPGYMERIRAHLIAERGMDEAKATATAIATATLFCKSGRSPNLPVQVKAAARTEACAAVAELQAIKAAPKPKEEAVASVTDKPWDGSPARFTDEQYARSCVLDRGSSVENAKERYSLPIREPDGTLNRNAVHAAAARIGQVSAARGLIAAAARALVAAYRQLREQPPDSLLKLAALTAAAAAVASAAQNGKGEQRDMPEVVEERSAPEMLSVEGRKLHGTIPYEVESRNLGGFTEVMRRGCLRNADLGDLVATVDHAGLPLGRYPGTLVIEDRDDGLHWSVELPESRSDVREAVERGDLRASSWRMVVARDAWTGNKREILEVRALRDVAVVTTSAYPHTAAVAEVRMAPEPEEATMEVEEEIVEEQEPEGEEETRSGGGGLRVEERSEHGGEIAGTLHERFKRAGWEPGVRAEIGWDEFLGADEQRAVTWTGSVDNIAPIRREAGPLGADRRYAWPAFGSVAVDPGTTSVQVLKQTARTLPDADDVVRAIDAVTPKPEADSTVTLVDLSLKQVAAVSKDIPNVFLAQDTIRTVIGADLRLTLNGGLDKLALDALATAPFHDPTTDALLVSIRKGITILQALGYSPDTVILTPEDSEGLDVLTTSGPEEQYVFGAGRFAPGQLFGLNVRVSKDAPEPIVADASAFGRMYASPVSLATFEQNSGETNTSLLRLEGHAAFGIERLDAAVRIAAA